MILAQLSAVIKILRNESVLHGDVITQPEFQLTENQRKLPSVKLQYKFKRKRSRVGGGRTSMKPFKNNPANRLNHINSYMIGLGVNANVHDVAVLEKTVDLNVKKTRNVLHLDGIIFVPTIGGIVVGKDNVYLECVRGMCFPTVLWESTFRKYFPIVETTFRMSISRKNEFACPQMLVTDPNRFT